MVKVLVVEDHEGLREYIAELLRLKGFEVIEAADGEEGLARVADGAPDVVLCDIMMEPLNGYDVLRHLRDDPATAALPVIFMSAKNDRQTMRHSMRLGADDFIGKPFTRSELLDAIDSRMVRQQQLIRYASKDLEHAKRQLMRMLTHELRTPLVSINMVADIISRQASFLPPDELQELLDTLLSGSKRLSRMVEQIIFITQLHAGAIREDVVREQGITMPLWEILVAAIGLARKYAYRSPNVDIELVERDTEARVICNMAGLKHALAELISNGLNFSPEGSQITVTQWLAEDRVWISITDQGAGIEPDQLEKALEQFQQIGRDNQEQQGIGLGLGLAHHLIAAHQGTLELRSVKGKGTQVIIGLPIYRADAAAESAPVAQSTA